MIQITAALPYLIAAIAAITLLSTAGAFASRFLHFKYNALAIVSYTVYMLIGYFISPKSGLSVALLAALITGFYDATVGWKLCKICKPNFGADAEILQRMTQTASLTIMLFVAPLFTFIGYLITVF